MKNIRSITAVSLFSLLVSVTTEAGVIIGGSTLLDSDSVATLEGWLGQGELELTNVFRKSDWPLGYYKNGTQSSFGATSALWHHYVNGKGPTFTVFEVVTSDGNDGEDHFLMGGYNPQSWANESNTPQYSPVHNVTFATEDRTAFIFNLTTNVMLTQCKATDDPRCGKGGGNSNGRWQTGNHRLSGPTWGIGNDLYVNSTLSNGGNNQVSYGLTEGDIGFGADSPLDNDDTQTKWIRVGELETFTINAAPVPSPASLAVFVAGLLSLYARRARYASHA